MNVTEIRMSRSNQSGGAIETNIFVLRWSPMTNLALTNSMLSSTLNPYLQSGHAKMFSMPKRVAAMCSIFFGDVRGACPWGSEAQLNSERASRYGQVLSPPSHYFSAENQVATWQ